MKEHQKELHAARQEQGLQRFDSKEGGTGEVKKGFKKFESYKREEQLPREVSRKRVSLVWFGLGTE